MLAVCIDFPVSAPTQTPDTQLRYRIFWAKTKHHTGIPCVDFFNKQGVVLHAVTRGTRIATSEKPIYHVVTNSYRLGIDRPAQQSHPCHECRRRKYLTRFARFPTVPFQHEAGRHRCRPGSVREGEWLGKCAPRLDDSGKFRGSPSGGPSYPANCNPRTTVPQGRERYLPEVRRVRETAAADPHPVHRRSPGP